MPEDNLTSIKMMNVTDSRQTRRTLVYSHCPSPQISSQTVACCYQNIGKSSAICKVEEGSNGLGEVTASVILDSDLYVGDKKVPYVCDVLARFRSSPRSDDKLSDMIKAY